MLSLLFLTSYVACLSKSITVDSFLLELKLHRVEVDSSAEPFFFFLVPLFF